MLGSRMPAGLPGSASRGEANNNNNTNNNSSNSHENINGITLITYYA